ncbi:MAG: tetratricopeptide repeat protein, partial [Gammaproteobacteria bacterium]|nr:tetratricopeptide repeat protein [Gammaproteobacteria bacterium]
MIDHAVDWQHAAALATHNRDWPALQKIADTWTSNKPASVQAWQVLSRSYFEQLQFDLAVAAFNKVLQLEPDNFSHQVAAARLATAAQHYDRARTLLENVISHAQQLKTHDASSAIADALYPLARVYHLTGEMALAEQYCRRSIDTRPGFPPAYTLLASLREGALDDADINAIRQLLNHPQLHPEYRAMLGFTLGDALDKRDDYANAFAAWQAANQVNQQIYEKEGLVYNSEQQEAEFDLLEQIFVPPLPAMHTSATDPATKNQARTLPSNAATKTPVFVLGMPRSGTTLAESILDR